MFFHKFTDSVIDFRTSPRSLDQPTSPIFMKIPAVFLASFVGISLGSLSALAVTTVATDPVGYIRLSVPAQSDAFVSAPLHRDAAFVGTVSSVAGGVITVAGTPGWTTNQFVFASGTQNNTYFAILKTGSKRGAYFTVTANSATSLTVDLNGDTLTEVVSGDALQLIPYWTLATLFPAGGGFPGSASFTPVGSVLFPSLTTAGVNLSSEATYFYYTGTAAGGPGWRRAGASPTLKFDHTVILPDIALTVRNLTGSSIALDNLGSAPMTGHSTIIGTINPFVDQDNVVSINAAASVSLANSGLISSGAMVGGATFTPVDTLFIFDNSIAGINKSSVGSYFYYSGTAAGGPGWRKVGSAPTTKFDDTTFLEPGVGYIIRKKGQATPTTVAWEYVAGYIN